MQLFELMTAIAAPGAERAGKVAAVVAKEGAAGFGQALDAVLGRGEGAQGDAAQAGARPKGKLGLIADTLMGEGPAADVLAGLQGVLQQVLGGQAPTQQAADNARAGFEAKLDSLSGSAREALGGRLEKMLARLDRAEAAVTGVDPKTPPEGWTEPESFATARQLLSALIDKAKAPAPATQAAAAVALPETVQAVAESSAERIAGEVEEAVAEAPQAAEVTAREPALPKPHPDPKPATRDVGVQRPDRYDAQPKPASASTAAGQATDEPKVAAADAVKPEAPKPETLVKPDAPKLSADAQTAPPPAQGPAEIGRAHG